MVSQDLEYNEHSDFSHLYTFPASLCESVRLRSALTLDCYVENQECGPLVISFDSVPRFAADRRIIILSQDWMAKGVVVYCK